MRLNYWIVFCGGDALANPPELVGGSKNSQHIKGQAADIASDAPIRLARIVIDRGLNFDQMILYPNFIHLSYTLERANRKQILYSKDYYGSKLQTL
ncbi:MAG: D-Ala-D-Ala carboxypeptidase family metallohydrolase [Candidatus Coprenecus sp.]